MNETAGNPYETPRATSKRSAIPNPDLEFYRDGDSLMVRDGAVLPGDRPVDGSAATGSRHRTFHLVHVPLWAIAAFCGLSAALIGVRFVVHGLPPRVTVLALAGAISAMYLRARKGKMEYELGRKGFMLHAVKMTAAVILLLLGAGLIYKDLADTEIDPSINPYGAASLIAGFAALLLSSPLRTAGYQDGYFRVKGFSRKFLDGFPQGPR